MNDSVIAGALFDFMGWLTSRPKRIMLSSADDASPAVDAITDFAKMRGLSLDDAKVQDWQDNTTPPAAPDLQAELDATNRQVEILSDALAESRREVAALKAVQEPVAWISHNAGLYHGKPDESLNPWPLYRAPPPCQTCEALARTVMMDQAGRVA